MSVYPGFKILEKPGRSDVRAAGMVHLVELTLHGQAANRISTRFPAVSSRLMESATK